VCIGACADDQEDNQQQRLEVEERSLSQSEVSAVSFRDPEHSEVTKINNNIPSCYFFLACLFFFFSSRDHQQLCLCPG
jgi:hypothetical protein